MDNELNKSSELLNSLDAFTENPVDSEDAPRKKKQSAFSFFRIVVILICASVFVYSVISLFGIQQSNSDSSKLYDDLYNEFASVLNSGITLNKNTVPHQSANLSASASVPSKVGNFNTVVEAPVSLKFQQSLSRLEVLKSKNTDTVGYISISGTGINYPLVQAKDNDYYLDHAFDNSPMKSGSIFYDWRCDPTPAKNKNLIVYGHNMINGSMFSQLEYFTYNEQTFSQGVITIYAFDAIYTYEIFSVYYTDAYTNYLSMYFNSAESFTSWLEKRAEYSIYKKDVPLNKDSQIISLSTCVNATSSGRIAVHGVLVNVER